MAFFEGQLLIRLRKQPHLDAVALFGLLVNVVSSWLSHRRESTTEQRKLAFDRKVELRNLYAENIAMFEKYMQSVQGNKPHDELHNESARVNSRMLLMSTEEIILQSEQAGDALQLWSSAHFAGSPKPLGDTGLAVISNRGLDSAAKSKELFEKLQVEMRQMVVLMRKHLDSV